VSHQQGLRRVRLLARATLVAGVAASVAANMLHARNNPISQGIAAWSPLALLLTVELVARVPVHRRSLAVVRIAATTTIAGIAAWVSYWHMAGVCARYGETPVSAHLMPLCVDGLVVVASISLVEIAGLLRTLDPATPAAQPTPPSTAITTTRSGPDLGSSAEQRPTGGDNRSSRQLPPAVNPRAPGRGTGTPRRRATAGRVATVRHPHRHAAPAAARRRRPPGHATAAAGTAAPPGTARSRRFDLIEAANRAWIDSTPADHAPPGPRVGQPQRRSMSMTAARSPAVEPAEAILTALAQLGQATAADTAAAAGVAYSTATRNLRELAAAGRVEKVQEGKQTHWRLPNQPTAVTTDDPDTDEPGTGEPDGSAPPQDDEPDSDASTTGDDTVADDAAPVPAPDQDAHATPAVDQPASEPAADPDSGVRSTVDTTTTAGAAAPAADDSGPTAQTPRRAGGTLDGAVLDVLEANPEQGFKVSELCKLINQANEGQEVAKASPGAVVLAAQRLVRKGKAVLAVEKPATFQLLTQPSATSG
jgi:hypothetical protein